MNLIPTILMLSLFSFSATSLILGILLHKKHNVPFTRGIFLVSLSLFINYISASIIILFVNTQGIDSINPILFKIMATFNYGTSIFFATSIYICIYALTNKEIFKIKPFAFLTLIVLAFAIVVINSNYIDENFPYQFWSGDMSATEFILGSIIRIISSLAIIPLNLWRKNNKKEKRVILFYIFIILTWGKFISAISLNVFLRSFFEFLFILYTIISVNIVLFISYNTTTKKPTSSDKLQDFNEYLFKVGITHREKEIAHMLIDGKTNKEIASEFNITVHTVKKHSSNIYNKTKTKDRYSLYRVYSSIK